MLKKAGLPMIVSLAVLIGLPVFFLFISLITGEWGYLIWSLPPSFLAGFTGLMVSRNISRMKNV
ncbi:hypothetical protein FZC79_08745 [Rossellomorea vietnamensis]|uniref:Uncharacterized protein n=1 Tax=Rossellomorea vietnamensis TaxID=218284 RepID=A0A5D4KG88_9BACI|nr:hypothetical protein [Rossellomorea vietnamensis]TYR75705.1 hypothetical protein FZC79_08745 [Rossellomorea vietnamensis]